MNLTIADVEKIATLAKLEFSTRQKRRLAKHLEEIVTYVDKLNELDTRSVEPTSHAVVCDNILREDEAESWLTQQQALENAPRQKNGYFSVPKVIDKE
ncbi:MAG: Asp-tRNA(Asn)/Glu-tRNA(Gln) amidotransferase subunit GatC [bacterium]